MKVFFALAVPALVLVSAAAVAPAGEQKLKPEELVARHLASIGTAELRSAIKSRMATGGVEMLMRVGGAGTIYGKGLVLSEDRKMYLGFAFGSSDYPGEQVTFNGEKVLIGQVRPGRRSALGSFLFSYDVIAREGLMGGVLSTAWPLLDAEARQAKLEYSGLRRIEGKQLHELRYRPRKGAGDLQVTLYFDSDTYRHVRTQYRFTRPAAMTSDPTQSASQVDMHYTLLEVFDQFKQVDGLTLPHSMRLDLTADEQNATMMSRWNFTITAISHNQPVASNSFAIR